CLAAISTREPQRCRPCATFCRRLPPARWRGNIHRRRFGPAQGRTGGRAQPAGAADDGGTMTTNPTRAGMVAVAGRPNVGKSTLVNALVGEKVSIVTPKPQTTRHRIIGIVTEKEVQIALVDTPGMHAKSTSALNRAMNETALASLAGIDLTLFVVEAGRWQGDDERA